MKKILLIAVFVLMIALMCSCGAEKKDDSNETTAADETTILETESPDFFKTDEEVFLIETPYCMLKYPAKWESLVYYVSATKESSYERTFSATFDDTNVPLYTIAFGKPERGYKLGILKTSDGAIDVYLTNEFDEEIVELLSEENRMKYYQMCEDVNVIVSKLHYDDGMELLQ